MTTITSGGAQPGTSADQRFDGWIVVGAVFVLFMTSAGLGFYGLAVYLDAITDEQGFSNSSVSLATSMFFLISAVVGRLMATPIERGYTRPLVIAGALLAGASLVAIGRVEAVWQLYIVYVVFAVGFALSGIIPGTTLITRWFHTRRSVALAVASTGLSVGGLTLTQLASWLIGRHGLSDATPWLGLIFVVVAIAASFFMWSDPESRGQYPDGATPTNADTTAGVVSGPPISYQQAVASRFFWTTTVAFFFAMAAQVGAIAHIANLGTNRVDRGTGALSVLALALASVMFRLLGGVVAGRVPIIGYTASLAFAQGASLIVLAESTSRFTIVAAAFFMGATVGNLLMLQPLIIADVFGVSSYARVFSFNQLMVTIGVAAGPFLLGALDDIVSYRLSYWVAATLSVIGATVFTFGGSAESARRTLADSGQT
jgi:MFS family permease